MAGGSRREPWGTRLCTLAGLILVLGSAVVPVRAGPPYVTDDPEPVEYRHWEIFFESQWLHAGKTVLGTVPAVEANYGLLPEVQLSSTVQLLLKPSTGSPMDYGPGDVEIGIKYRFLQEKVGSPQASIYPAVILPTGDSSRGLGEGTAQLFLPLWFQKSSGHWTTYGGGGFQTAIGRSSERCWMFGWEGQREVSNDITAGAELFAFSHQDDYRGAEIGCNIGLTVNVSPRHQVLGSLGRDITGRNQLTGYIGYLFLLGPNKE